MVDADRNNFGRYKIQNELGRGGMATVFRAFDTHRQHDVALKVLPRAFLHEIGFRERFEREARTIISLEHYAIVPVYDFGAEDDQPFIAMRLMPGGSLHDKLKNGPLSLKATATIMRRICAALDKAHDNGLIHRDLKPGNILFDDNNQAYLADFGIARLAEGTQTVTMVGTPQYMAPEQATGQPLDRRTDVYQMGAVLFEMLTGAVPFNAPTPVSLLYKHTNEPVPDVRAFNQALPAGADLIVQRAMAKRPADRYASTGALAADVFALAAGKPLSVLGATLVEPVAPIGLGAEQTYIVPQPATPHSATTAVPAAMPGSLPQTAGNADERRQPVWMWLFGLVALLIIIGGGFVLWRQLVQAEPEPDEPAIAVLSTDTPTATLPPTATDAPTATLEPSTATPIPPTATPVLPTATPFGLTTLFGGGAGLLAFSADTGSGFEIHLADLDGSNPRPITSLVGDAYSAVWSPDGSRIAFDTIANDQWDVVTMRADGSEQVNISRNSADDSFPTWSPDGRYIAFHSNRGRDFEIYIANSDGSGLRQVTNNDVDDHGPDWSPDGTQLAFDRLMGRQRQVFTITVDGIFERQLTNTGENNFPDWSPDGNTLVFVSTRDGFEQLYLMDADGSNQRRLTFTNNETYYPEWSPNGEWIIYHAALDNGNRDVFAISADGSKTRQITNASYEERQPSWQPPLK